MPAFPQNILLPAPPPKADPEAMRTWAESLTREIGNAWQSLVYVLNALSIVDTLANRPATPALDHILFTASDTGETFVGVSGAWVAVNTLNQRGANGQRLQIGEITELHTLAAAATSDTTIQFPAGSLGLGVAYRVTTTITGATSFDLGIAGATDRYFDDAGLTGTGAVAKSHEYAAATALRFTANGSNFTGGVVRVVGYYVALTAPTS